MKETGGEYLFHDVPVMTNILEKVKRLIDVGMREAGIYADFTMGNGFDTLYLSKNCPEGSMIYAFDVQSDAIESTKRLLDDENCPDNYRLIFDSHENFDAHIPQLELGERIKCGVFNLGYRPTGDKKITTLRSSTLAALRKAVDFLDFGGVIVAAIYPGHEEGAAEGELIREYGENLDSREYDVLYHRLINIKTSPYIIGIQKKNKL